LNNGGPAPFNGVRSTAIDDEVSRSGKISLGDVDGDGNFDLVVVSKLYLNNGSAAPFAGVSGSSIDDQLDYVSETALGDVDGDGDLDLVGSSELYLNNGSAAPFAGVSGSPIGSDVRDPRRAIALGDADSDGHLDLIVGYDVSSKLYLHPSSSGGLPNNPPTIAVARPDAKFPSGTNNANFLSAGRIISNTKVVSIPFTLFDPEGDLVSVRAEYSLDGGGNWHLGVPLADSLPQSFATLAKRFSSNITVPLPIPDIGFTNVSLEIPSVPSVRPIVSTDVAVVPQFDHPNPAELQLSLVGPDGLGARLENDGRGIFRPAIGQPNLIGRPAIGAWRLQVTDTTAGNSGRLIGWQLRLQTNGVGYFFPLDTSASQIYGQSDTMVVRLLVSPSPIPQRKGLPGPFQYASMSASTFPFRLRSTIARAVDEVGEPVTGALVYRLPASQQRNGQLLTNRLTGQFLPSGAAGYVNSRDPIQAGDKLVAVLPISTTDTLTYAYTSAAPTADGLAALTVGPAGGTQTLVVSPDNPLLLLNLSVSLEWDARGDSAYLDQLRARLSRASELLYDWSNGQIALGALTIYQNKEHWDEADIQVYASNQLRPNATQGGIVSAPINISYAANQDATYEPGQIRVGANWSSSGDAGADSSEDWARALAHELGHYALFLDETYLGREGNLLVPVSGCSSPMADPYVEGASEFRPSGDWLPACQATLQNQSTGLSEWALIKRFYDHPAIAPGRDFILHEPASLQAANPGPALLPIGVTTTRIVTPTGAAATTPLFSVVPPGGGRYEPSAGTRAFLFRESSGRQIVDLGAPTVGAVLARGYQAGDRLCVFDPEAEQLGCQSAGGTLNLQSLPGWRPEVRITPSTVWSSDELLVTLTLSVTVPVESVAPPGGSLPLSLQVRLYPEDGSEPAVPFNLFLRPTQHDYQGVLTLPPAAEVVEAGYLQIWVDEGGQRRETVVDYAIGGNPAPRRRKPRRSLRRAPAVSPDGQATMFADNISFNPGQFFALQSTASLPTPPPWATIVSQGYRLLASEPALLANPLALSISYAEGDVPFGLEQDVRVLFHDGTSWRELPTRVDSARNEAAVQVQSTPGVYVLMTSLRLSVAREGWSLIYAYPGANQVLPTALLAAEEQNAYTAVYGYDAEDEADPWKVYSPRVPSWVNDLTGLEQGESYWLRVTNPVTISLRIPDSTLNAQALLPPPPSTIYGLLTSASGITPAVGLTVTAQVGSATCGTTTTRDTGGGKIGFVVDILARDGEAVGCGTQAAPVTLTFLNGTQSLLTRTVNWDNTAVRRLFFGWPNDAPYSAFLPLTTVAGADLTVTSVEVVPADPNTGTIPEVRVTIRNTGSVAVTRPFWVDLYVDPDVLPGAGETWQDVSPFGASWRVYGLRPGETRMLSTRVPNDPGDPTRNYTDLSGLGVPGRHTLYAQVDVFAPDGAPTGVITEQNEANNLFGPRVVNVPK